MAIVLTFLFYDTEQWFIGSPRRDYLYVPTSTDIPTTRSICVTFFLHLRRRRRQRSMKFAKSWGCKESQTACMVAKLLVIALMAGLRKWPTIVKRISSTPIGFGCGTSCFVGA